MQPREAFDHEPGANQQDDGNCRFRDDEHRARRSGALPGRAARAVVLQECGRIPSQNGNGRDQAEHDAGDEREREGEQQHGHVQRGFGRAWNLRRAQRDQRLDAPHADREPGRRAGERQDDPLGQQLRDDAAASRAKRRANGELAPPRRRAHQQQVRDVGARNQEQQDDARLQNEERRADVADELIAQSDRISAEAARLRERLKLRQAFEVARHDRLELSVRLVDGRPGAQARDHRAELIAAALVGHLLRRERERNEQRDVARRNLEVRRQDADDAIRFAVDADVASDD